MYKPYSRTQYPAVLYPGTGPGYRYRGRAPARVGTGYCTGYSMI
jgi:hypothetical protein